jgi:hypothetical protein
VASDDPRLARDARKESRMKRLARTCGAFLLGGYAIVACSAEIADTSNGDGGADAAKDATVDAASETAAGDSAIDAPNDVATADGPFDAASDSTTDVATDAAVDVAADVAADVTADVTADVVADVATDVTADVVADSPADAPADVSDGGSCGPSATAAFPVAPSAGNWMWQGQQTRFKTATGCACTAQVAIGVGDQAVCFAGTGGALQCAGAIYTSTFPLTSFATAGETGVDQILISPTFNSANGNAICVHESNGAARCMGNYNSWGQFGDATNTPSASFVTWGATSLAAIATGTWDQICALDASGHVACSGNGFGTTPVVQGDGGVAQSFWVTTFGTVSINDTSLFRTSESRSECKITSAGMVCAGGTLGTAGSVVMGGYVKNVPGASGSPHMCSNGMPEPACWLDSSGSVFCQSCDSTGALGAPQAFFAGRHSLAIGLNFYGTLLCAVIDDGSVQCLGSSTGGAVNAPSAPAGSVPINCY